MSEETLLTTTEKIDYIFDYVVKEKKKNRNKMISKWIFRLFIIAYIFYVYFYLWPMAKDFYTKIFPTTTQSTQSGSSSSTGAGDIQIGSLKINSEKAAQIRALFCK